MIPKHIFSIWLNDDPVIPELQRKCIESQKIEGYTHHLITLDNLETDSQYVRDAIRVKKWVKASDYIRCEYMYKHGGWHMDADMSILEGKNFNDLLDNEMVTSRECAGLLAQAGFGAVPRHPYLKDYMDVVERNFRGDGEMVFEPGIRAFDDLLWYYRKEGKDPRMTLIPTEVFFPYNHITGVTNITPQTKVIHKYARTWVK